MSVSYVKQEIDHSQGHSFLHDGTIFYLPNCSHKITIPPRTLNLPYPFPAWTTRIHSFLTPRWWRTPYPYLPFVPLRPSFSGVFAVLENLSLTFQDEKHAHSLDTHVIENWMQVEDQLIQMVSHMRRKFDRMPPFLVPIPPSLLGFPKRFLTASGARSRAYISRDWFGMWMGLVALLIANVETYHPVEAEDDENWFAVLTRCGTLQYWLGSLQTSDAAVLSPRCPRVGVISDFLSEETQQPKVEWFCAFDIPVWYPWTAEHAKAVNAGRNMEYLCPPSHFLQSATTFLTRLLSSLTLLKQNSADDMTGEEFEAARDAYLETKPWETFFNV